MIVRREEPAFIMAIATEPMFRGPLGSRSSMLMLSNSLRYLPCGDYARCRRLYDAPRYPGAVSDGKEVLHARFKRPAEFQLHGVELDLYTVEECRGGVETRRNPVECLEHLEYI